MSSNNIFNTINRYERKVGSTFLTKDGSSSSSSPFSKPKKKEKAPMKNDLCDVTQSKNPFVADKKPIFERIILFILALFGKQNEWKEARNKIQALNNRINTFENIINESSGKNVTAKIKDYHV